ncbi:MAG: hypothetical protein PHR14_03585 [Oscillospiraceae bacterium]|nr:hypothetical protein [Oscillospiraceae bacterium]
MNKYDMWDAFAKTGRVEDYLRYRGVDIYNMTGREERHRDDKRRPDNKGKQ